jgi:D-alanyl-lipoteichoic acid acyltransferase DltB (MBOAT superfamily)
MAVKQKWLFSAAPIILNGPIHQANDMFGKSQERRDERSQHETKAARFLVVVRTR